jgi:outer membrane receptor for ferrienterochelin and colicins
VGAQPLGATLSAADTGGAVRAPGAPRTPGAAVAAEPTLRGVVVDAESGRPVGEAEVIVQRAGDGRGAPARAVVRAGTDGAWQVAGLPAGRYQLRARRIGYLMGERTVRLEGAAAPEAIRLALTPQAVSLETAVVTASRRIQRLKEAPVAVQLVGRRDIEQSGATNVAAVLTEQAGLQPDGGTPSGVGVMLQGMDAQRVLILLDGQPLTGRINGNFDLSRLPRR